MGDAAATAATAPGRLAMLVSAEMAASGRWQYEIAGDVGISEKHLSQLVNGKVGMSVGMAERILGAVGRRLVLGTVPAVEAGGQP